MKQINKSVYYKDYYTKSSFRNLSLLLRINKSLRVKEQKVN